jgi:hypothetical protein
MSASEGDKKRVAREAGTRSGRKSKGRPKASKSSKRNAIAKFFLPSSVENAANTLQERDMP